MGKNCYKKPPFSLDLERRGDLTAQLVSALRRAIETGYYRAGDVLPPVRDLAALLGVSPCIAARAVVTIRDEGLVSPRPRIGCVVCPKDRPLWKGHVVIVVPPDYDSPMDNAICAVLRDTLITAGYIITSVTVAPTRPNRYDDFALLETVLRQQADIVVQIHDQDKIANWLSKRAVPFVRLTAGDCRPPHCAGIVRHDTSLALPELGAHCRKTGVKDAMLVYSFPSLDKVRVLEGEGVRVSTWRAPASLKHGLGFDLATWAAEAFTARLAKGRDWLPELLLFADDHLATGALMALGVAGVRIPEDVRVVTLANKNYGPVFVKPLTRIEMDNAAIGAKIAECVLEYLGTGVFPEGVVVGPIFIKGETF